MTTPTGPVISMDHILAELKQQNPARTNPIWLGDADVLALAQASGTSQSTPNTLLALMGRTASGGTTNPGGGGGTLPPTTTPLTVSFTPVSVAVVSRLIALVTGTTLATTTGGSGIVASWTWSIDSPQVTLVPAAASCTFSARLAAGAEINAAISLRVVDSAGAIALASFPLHFENTL